MKEFLPQYNPKEVEEKTYRIWERSGFFNPDRLPPINAYRRGPKRGLTRKKTYCITVPPPNITGSLHMGHALNATIQDILIRKKRMEGYKTLWLPGTDHAGIATQNVVEKELRKQSITRHDLGREKFLEKVWEWKEKYGHIILDQFKKLGASMDWSRIRFTMDPDYQYAVRVAFTHYYERGWIYQGERTVNWCTRCATSLSDLEVEYDQETAELYFIKYGPLTVATVRPETKLGDTAVAVNPKDQRYKQYIGNEIDIETVLGPAKMKVVADPEVDMNFGTGVIKVTPAHDLHDFELGQKYDLEKKQVIGPDGRMTELAGKYAGLKIKEAREQIVEDMKKIGILVKTEPYTHNVAKCYRCGTVLEPILSKQWFLKMDKLAERAIRAVKSGRVKFRPKRWEKIYFDWLKNVRDWTVSRQIWWGHRLPVYFCGNKQEGNSSAGGFVVSAEKPTACPFCKHCNMEQSADVLDTWFSSALWPFATLGWPEACTKNQKSKIPPHWGEARSTQLGGKNRNLCKPLRGSDLELYYPTQVLSTARDIINLWVTRMIFSGLEFMDQAPFKEVVIHATILTKDGKRMSKSLGTGVDPMDLTSRYGADAVRFGLIWQAMGTQDIHWSEEHVVAGRKFCNKVWNAARFVLTQNGKFEARSPKSETNFKLKITNLKQLTAADRKILTELRKTEKEVNVRTEKYEFGQALHVLYDFFWHKFCDKYLEASKVQLTNPRLQKNTGEVLLYILTDSLRLLHPFMPFITEELWSKLPTRDKKLLIIERWHK